MNGSFLRASLFTSVVSFGVAAMAMGLGSSGAAGLRGPQPGLRRADG
jgi:hypothetical protein